MKQKFYKSANVGNNNILPNDLKRSSDDSFYKALVFIDAGFLSKLSKYSGGGKYLRYDLIGICKNIPKKQNLVCKHIYYYAFLLFQRDNSTKEESERYKRYKKFKNALSMDKIIFIREEKCQRAQLDGEFVFCQRGVDAPVIMGLISIPLDCKVIKKIMLTANDSDFVPAINKLRVLGMKIILYTYYSEKRQSSFAGSNELLKSVLKYVQLNRQDFDDAILKKEKHNE